MKNILVLGAGMSATDLIYYLLDRAEENDWFVTVGDVDVEKARMKLRGNPRGKAIYFDCHDDDLMDQHIRGADITMSLLPPGQHAKAGRYCVKYGSHLVTASYTADDMWELDAEAKAKGLTLLNELGADPGIDHMNAMRVLDRVRARGARILSFESCCGSLIAPESNDNPWGYKFTWSPMNVITAGLGGARFVQGGQNRIVPYHRVFQQPVSVDIPGLGRLEAYPNRDSISYRETYQLDNVPNLVRSTLRMPGFIESWHQFINLGLTEPHYRIAESAQMTYRQWVATYLPFDKDRRPLEEVLPESLGIDPNGEIMERILWTGVLSNDRIPIENATPAEIMLDLLSRKWKFRDHDTDMIVFIDKHIYELDGTTYEHTAHMIDKGLNHLQTAISRTVGLPAAIAIRLILEGKINTRGVILPVLREVYEPVLAELASFGIEYSNTEVEIDS